MCDPGACGVTVMGGSRDGAPCNVVAVLRDGRVLYQVRHGREPRVLTGYWYSFDRDAADAFEPIPEWAQRLQFDARERVGDGTYQEVRERLIESLAFSVR